MANNSLHSAQAIKKHTNIGLFDGYYAKLKFVDRAVELDFVMISKLRKDANLKYLYEGEQKPRGRHRKYDGKVDYEMICQGSSGNRFSLTSKK